MRFCKLFQTLLAAAGCLILSTGCQEILVENGKYETRLEGRQDFAAVYGDLIFLRVRNPRENGISGGYWEWAGKYNIDAASNRIYLEMNKKTARDWNFYFEFYRQRDSICVVDLSLESSYDLHFNPAQSDETRRRLKRQSDAEADLDTPDNGSSVYR